MNEIENKLNDIIENIEELVKIHQIDYVDACLLYCEQKNIEIEHLGDIIRNNSKMKSKLQKEAEHLRFLKR